MRSNALSLLALFAHAAIPGRADPTWPNRKIDNLEDILFLQSGYIREGFSDGVATCAFSSHGDGRTSAAEWVRTAFHDFATHDAAAGTGGLDASISFETARAENPGTAFISSFGFFLNYYSARASMADLIALGVRIALNSCRGPTVPFRAGRIDADAAGPSGVPEPQNDLVTIRTRFAGAGFAEADMIALTACGHTLGGVHGEDFPQITGNASVASFPKFDATYAAYDNAVVTDYLAGNTSNPLVVGPAETDSDARVFAADGNDTMRALADPAVFRATCARLLQRMIDSVPSAVELSDPIEAYTIKPSSLQLNLNANGTLTFGGRIRVRTTGLTDTNFTVALPYATRDGVPCASCTIATTRPTFQQGISIGFNESFVWQEFSTTLPADTSISSFNVTVQSASGTTTYTNNGNGYPVQDRIIYQQAQSCWNTTDDGTGHGNLTVVAAVRNGETAPATLAYPVAASLSTFDVVLGEGAERVEDGFKSPSLIAGVQCQSLV